MSAAANNEAQPTPAAGGGSPAERILFCTFCFKSQHEVRKLISGPAGVFIFICDECVDLCNGRAGLAPRPLSETVADTWAWLAAGGELADWRDELRVSGLSPEAERALLRS